MKDEMTKPVEPYVPELPPFELQPPAEEITILKQKRTYTLSLKVKKTSTSYHKVLHLDDNTDLDLTLKLVK